VIFLKSLATTELYISSFPRHERSFRFIL